MTHSSTHSARFRVAAALLLSSALPVAADVLYSNLQDLSIPTNFDGVYIDIESGTNDTSGTTFDWDVNLFFGGIGVVNSTGFQPVRETDAGNGTLSNLAWGDTVNSSSTFDSSGGTGGSTDHLGSTFTAGTEGYIGFELTGGNYGWMRVVLDGSGSALVKDWAYDTSGSTGAIATGNVLQSGSTVTVDSTSGSFTLGSVVSGSNSLVKNGSGTTTLNATNTYTGGTTLNDGTITVANASALGTGTVTLAGGTLRTDTVAVSLANAIDVSGTTTVFSGSANLALTGAITGSGTLNVGGSGDGQGTNFRTNIAINTLNGFTGTLNLDTTENYVDIRGANTSAKLMTSGSTSGEYVRLWGDSTFGELSGTGGSIAGTNNTLTINQSTNTTYAGSLRDVNGNNELGFTKGGSGSLTFTGANSYEWDTIVNGGTLEVQGSINETERITVAAGAAFKVTGSGSLGSGGVYSGGGSGPGDIVNNGTFTYNSTTDQTFTGVVSGSGALIKDNSSTLTLSGANTFSGATTIDGGELVLSGSAGIGHRSATTLANGATLSFTSTGNINNTWAGRSIVLQDGSTLQNLSANNFTLFNTQGGGTTVDTGASVIINHTSNAGGTGFFLDDGLKSTGADTTATVTINTTNAGSGVNLRNNNTTFAGTLIVNGIASATEGAGSGIGVSGNTTGLQNADIQLNGTMELKRSSSNNLAISWANDGSAASTFQMGALSGSGVMVGNHDTAGGTALVTLGNTNNDGTFSGVIANGVNNTTSITKVGSGTQTLSGANTYTGATTVSSGILLINNTTGTGAVTVASGATLGGSGTIGGATTIQSGGFLAPGNSPGILTFVDALTLDAGSFTNMEITGSTRGTGYDGIDVGGVLTYGGALTLTSNTLIGVGTYNLFDFTGDNASESGDFTSIILSGEAYANGLSFTLDTPNDVWEAVDDSQTYTFYNGSGNLVVAVVVPEPRTYALLGGMFALTHVMLRRRR